MQLSFEIGNKYKEVKCQLDTAATCSVIGYENLKKILESENPELTNCNTRIKGFGDAITYPIGQIVLNVVRYEKKYKLNFYVVSMNQIPLLSSGACNALKLIKVCYQIKEASKAKDIIEKYNDVFDGIGKVEGKISLEIDNTVKPIVQAPRRVPVMLKDEFKKIIDDLISSDIIEKVEYHTEWVSNVVIVKRENKLRICLDPVDLNRAIRCRQ